MGATAKKIADQFIGAAHRNPGDRPEIFRKAAYTFMGLAQDPKNARTQRQLVSIGLEFANAAVSTRPATMDDFADLLQETQIAYNEVGDDPMDLVARRREVHEERTPRTPGQVFITPESFNKDATLGRSQVIKFAPTEEEKSQGIQQSQNVAFWQGSKKEAQALTVDISLGFLPVAENGGGEFAGASVRAYAEIEFGSDGNRTKVPIDIAFGKRVTAVGNYLSVSVGMGPPAAGKAAVAITAGASIGVFAAPSLGLVAKTEYIDGLAVAATTELIAVPLKAVALLPLQSSLGLNENAVVTFYGYDGNRISDIYYRQSSTSWMLPVPLYGDVAFVSVTNTVGNAGQADFRLVFQLAL